MPMLAGLVCIILTTIILYFRIPATIVLGAVITILAVVIITYSIITKSDKFK